MTKEQFFTQLDEAGKWHVGATIARTNALPLDRTSVFASYASAAEYASSSPLAYPGQIISVINDENTEAYVINLLGELQTISGGGGGSPDAYTSLGQWAFQTEVDFTDWSIVNGSLTGKPEGTELMLSAPKKKNNIIITNSNENGAYIYYITPFDKLTFTCGGFDASMSIIKSIEDGVDTYYVYKSNQKLTDEVNLTIY